MAVGTLRRLDPRRRRSSRLEPSYKLRYGRYLPYHETVLTANLVDHRPRGILSSIFHSQIYMMLSTLVFSIKVCRNFLLSAKNLEDLGPVSL